jgi:predicted P-loop ATPase
MSELMFDCVWLGTWFCVPENCWKPLGIPLDAPNDSTCTPWNELARFITEDRRVKDKGEVKLFIPGKLHEELRVNDTKSTLINENVQHLSFLAIDIEGGGTEATPAPFLTDEDIAGIASRLAGLQFQTQFYNSHNDGAPGKGRRGRILVPLAAPIVPAEYGQTRESQGTWWSRHIFIPLVEHVIGDWIRHPGIRSGVEGAKILCGKYYVRSAPADSTADTWCFRFGENHPFLDARDLVRQANVRAAQLGEIGMRDATGMGIPSAKLKRTLKLWQNSEDVDDIRAHATFEKIARGERGAEEGAGFDTFNLLCRKLAKHCRPFDPKVVAKELFERSCRAWAEVSKKPVEFELDWVAKRLKFWLETFEKDALDFAAATRGWRDELLMRNDGEVRVCLSNLVTIFAKHPAWEGVLGFNERADQVCFLKEPPAPSHVRKPEYPAAITDTDCTALTVWFAAELRIPVENKMVSEAIDDVAKRHGFDPVKTYLDEVAQAWDGVSRLQTWLIDYAGAEDNTYVRTVSERWLISGVARVYDPGCKADQMLVLEGPQGCGKSTLYRTLCPRAEWFSDHLPDLHSKDAVLALRNKWIIEVNELNAIYRSTNESTKKFLSTNSDSFRAPYARHTRDVKRRVIFGGSTNARQYTSDPTGARRFWGVRIEAVDLATLDAVRDELWAEAVHRYREGAVWWLDTPFLQRLAAKVQEERREPDPFEEKLEELLEFEPSTVKELPEKHDRTFEAIGKDIQVWRHKDKFIVFREAVYRALDFASVGDRSKVIGRRVRESMRALGWELGPTPDTADGRQRTFVKCDQSVPEAVPIR